MCKTHNHLAWSSNLGMEMGEIDELFPHLLCFVVFVSFTSLSVKVLCFDDTKAHSQCAIYVRSGNGNKIPSLISLCCASIEQVCDVEPAQWVLPGYSPTRQVLSCAGVSSRFRHQLPTRLSARVAVAHRTLILRQTDARQNYNVKHLEWHFPEEDI